jgi:hypothetical protein
LPISARSTRLSYTTLFDRCILGIAGDLKSKFARAIQPFVTTSTTVDFGARTVRGGNAAGRQPTSRPRPTRISCRARTAAIAAAASAAAALVSQLAAAASATVGERLGGAAAASFAAILANPDDGLVFRQVVGSTTR